MIVYNTKDFGLKKIQEKLKDLEKFNLKNRYRIYGLLTEEHPNEMFIVRGKINTKTQKFLAENNILYSAEPIESQKYTHSIGIRKDLRSNVKVSSLLLFTIIGLLEEFIKTNKSLKIKNLDKKIGKLTKTKKIVKKDNKSTEKKYIIMPNVDGMFIGN